jgi:stringent starvation protein B
MRSRRPYLLRAMYEWMVDDRQTPYVLVDARQDGVRVPEASVHEGRIVLNIGPGATHRLTLGNDELEFDARFGGVSHHVVVPVRAVLAIYARETGQGMMFGLEDDAAAVEAPAAAAERDDRAGTPKSDDPRKSDGPPKGRPSLKVVK